MNKYLLFSGLLSFLFLLTNCSNQSVNPYRQIEVTNHGPAIAKMPFSVALSGAHDFYSVTNESGKTIIGQLEDHNHNGLIDHIFFIDDVASGQNHYYINSGEGTSPSEGVSAFIFGSDSTSIMLANDLWGFAYHTPTARISVYHKSQPSTDLTDSEIRNAALTYQANNGIGLGGPSTYDYEDVLPLLETGGQPTVHIAATGSLRNVVEINYSQVNYRNDQLAFKVTLTQVLGEDGITIEVEALNNTQHSLQYGVGMTRSDMTTGFTQGKADQVSFAYTFGPQSVNDEQLGLGVYFHESFGFDNYQDDPNNDLVLMYPVQNKVRYQVVVGTIRGNNIIVQESEFVERMRILARNLSARKKLLVKQIDPNL